MQSSTRTRGVSEVLDDVIEETMDLNTLNTLLDIKLSNYKPLLNSRKLSFDPSSLFSLTNENINFDLALNILLKASRLDYDVSSVLSYMVKYILTNHDILTCQQRIILLLDSLIQFSTKDAYNSIFKELDTDFVYNFLIKALHNTAVRSKSYETLIKYLQLLQIHDQIKCFNAVSEFCIENKNLDILCALLSYITTESITSENCCLNTDEFWVFIECCISGSESHLQKQGEYILSKYIFSFGPSHLLNHLFPSDMEHSWRAFFILVDIGREKQLHLVQQSFSMYKYIIKFPFLWQNCIYKIYLNHPQSTVVYQIATEILESSYNKENLRGMFAVLFPAININEYNDLSCKLFQVLQKFCHVLNKEELDIVISELIKISWNPISFWKIIQNVLPPENPASKMIALYQEIINCASNLHHVYIRNQCLKYLVHIFWDQHDYPKIYKIINSLKTCELFHQNHLELCNFSTGIIDSVVNDVVQFDNELQKIQLHFKILGYMKVDIWSHFQKYLSNLNPHVKLFLYRECLMNIDLNKICTLKFEEIGLTFLIKYFNEELCSETTEIFIEVLKLLVANFNLVIDKWAVKMIDEPLFSSKFFNENQIYVSLILLQAFWYNHYFKLGINIKMKEHLDTYTFQFFKNNDLVKEVRVDNVNVCNECIHIMFHLSGNEILSETTQQIIKLFTNMCEIQDNMMIFNVYKKVYQLLTLSTCPNLVIDFIDLLHRNLLQMKRDHYFKEILNEFLKTVYSEYYLKHNNYRNVDSVSKDLLYLSELYTLVRYNWLMSLKQLCISTPSYYDKFLETVVALYLQGIITTKDERTEFNICQEFNIKKSRALEVPLVMDDLTNPNLLLAHSRIVALEILMSADNHELVIDYLRQRYMLYFKKRYFPDSKIHYEKLRILQAILMLLPAKGVSENSTKELNSFVLEVLQEEANQNCVKQLLNWILILISNDVTPVLEWIKSKPCSMTQSFVINLIPTICHLTLHRNEEILETTLNFILPWTMGAQFKSRVYAQHLIRRIFQNAKHMKYDSILNKYKHLEDCINSCIKSTGDIFENTMKSDLPFLNDFHPFRDKSVSTIFCDIPRLHGVHPTEWLNMQSCFAENDALKNHCVSCSVFEEAIDAFLSKRKSDINQTEKNGNVSLLHIQKKITPWKSALENANANYKTDFILIASLVGKAQNLGGLSRTCEVFGIRRIVFNDAKVVNNKEFKSLSMSSESWIMPIEVKVKDLKDYVGSLQKEGYLVVGAEQTAGSKKLHEFQYPRKVALVLGNEKTGIPADVIPLLNICLEIPQFGQTRSLNVHVAGATFIWEYAKQHLV